MIGIGFINPSSEYLFDPFRGDPFTHFHLLTILEDAFGGKIDAMLIDLRGIKKEYATYHIPERDVYLHSVYTLDWEEQVSVVKALRKIYPEAKHIAGGPHAQAFPKESAEVFDSLILGEGETMIVRAVEDFMAGKLEKQYRQTKPVDINAYPHDRRHFLPVGTISRPNLMALRAKPEFKELLGTTVIFSRGCPYNCHFCAIRQARENFPGIRYRKPQHVAAELEYLKRDYGIQAVVLTDEICIPLKKDLALPHLETIGRAGVVWRGQCRVDGVTPEIAKLAKESGCVAMGMGVESVHQTSLDLINKRISIERSKQTIALFKENGIEVRVYMILGLPGEPPDIVEKTWSFIEETDPDLVVLSLFTIRPGTEVYNHPEKFGIRQVLGDPTKTMHMYGRYDSERPTLSFEYEPVTPWGKSFTGDQIVNNYLELQNRLKERNISNAYYKK